VAVFSEVESAMATFFDTSGVMLELEGHPQIPCTGLRQLYAAIDRMKPTGPSFVILARENCGYAQAGGGDGRFVVEWREFGEPFVHLVAGKGTPSDEACRVKMSGGGVEVLRHEVLTMDDVKTLLGAFLVHGRQPKGYVWRDITAALNRDCAGPSDEITELYP
jgi:hypothetical protein